MNQKDAILDAMWKLHQEHWNLVRHHETQRSNVTGALIAIAAGLIGLVTFDRSLSHDDLPLAILLSTVGVFGARFSAKQWERATLHSSRASAYRDSAIKLIGDEVLESIKEKADKAHNEKFPRLHRVRMHNYWIGLNLVIAVIGLVLTTLTAR